MGHPVAPQQKWFQKKQQQVIPEKIGKMERLDTSGLDCKNSKHWSRDSLPFFAWKYYSMVQGGPLLVRNGILTPLKRPSKWVTEVISSNPTYRSYFNPFKMDRDPPCIHLCSVWAPSRLAFRGACLGMKFVGMASPLMLPLDLVQWLSSSRCSQDTVTDTAKNINNINSIIIIIIIIIINNNNNNNKKKKKNKNDNNNNMTYLTYNLIEHFVISHSFRHIILVYYVHHFLGNLPRRCSRYAAPTLLRSHPWRLSPPVLFQLSGNKPYNGWVTCGSHKRSRMMWVMLFLGLVLVVVVVVADFVCWLLVTFCLLLGTGYSHGTGYFKWHVLQ